MNLYRLLLLVIIVTGQARGQALSSDITAVLASLERTSPVLAEARTNLEAARAEFTAARALPNPVLFIQNEQLSGPGSDTREQAIGGRQDLSFIWSLAARVSAGSNRYRAGLAAYDEVRRQVEIEVLTTLHRANSLREQLALIDTVIVHGRRIQQVAEARKSEGEISGFDVQRIQNEVIALSAQRASAAAEYSENLNRLVRVTGLSAPELERLPQPEADEPPFTEISQAIDHARRHRPYLTEANLEARAARSALTAARLDMLPDLTFALGQKTADTDYTGSVWELELEIPLFQQGRTSTAMANARRRQAEIERRAREQMIEQEVRGSFERWQSLRNLNAGTAALSPATVRRDVERALLLYTEGHLSAFELADALQSAINAHASLTQLSEQRVTAALQLRLFSGLPVWE